MKIEDKFLKCLNIFLLGKHTKEYIEDEEIVDQDVKSPTIHKRKFELALKLLRKQSNMNRWNISGNPKVCNAENRKIITPNNK